MKSGKKVVKQHCASTNIMNGLKSNNKL